LHINKYVNLGLFRLHKLLKKIKKNSNILIVTSMTESIIKKWVGVISVAIRCTEHRTWTTIKTIFFSQFKWKQL